MKKENVKWHWITILFEAACVAVLIIGVWLSDKYNHILPFYISVFAVFFAAYRLWLKRNPMDGPIITVVPKDNDKKESI